MAVLGLTKLSAVNRILRSVNILPVSALDPGGSSMQARAEEILNEINIQIQTRGLQTNTAKARDYTPSGSQVQVSSDVLAVRGAGKDSHRNFTLRGDKVYDLDSDTVTISAAITIDVVKLISFEDLPPAEKEYIANEASTIFQRRWRGDPGQDVFQRDETGKTAPFAKSPGPRPGDGPMNPIPASALAPAISVNQQQ